MVTFAYIVGGQDKFYKMLECSILSIKRNIKSNYKILILDNGKKLPSNYMGTKVVHLDVPKKLHMIWSSRYLLYKYAETDYVLYLDVDTVVINDKIEQLIQESDDKFYVCKHWWIPTFGQAVKELKPLTNVSIPDKADYFASGVFLFHSKKHKYIFEEYQNVLNECYQETDTFKKGVTDEYMLANTLYRTKGYKLCHGSLNHACNPSYMPMEFKENTIWGKNPFEEHMEKVCCLHCDITLRNPTMRLSDDMKKFVIREFML